MKTRSHTALLVYRAAVALTVAASLALPGARAVVLYVDCNAPGPTHDGLSWQTGFLTITEALSAATTADEIWVADGTYEEAFVLTTDRALYGGFAGTESERSQRDPAVNVTKIDAGGNRNAFKLNRFTGAGTVIDGFTIQNGDYGITSDEIVGAITVKGNLFKNQRQVGVSLSGSMNLLGNRFEGIGSTNLSLGGAVIVSGNEIIGQQYADGIVCSGAATITNNTVNGCYYGIRALQVPLTVSSNYVFGQQANGIYLSLNSGATTLVQNNLVERSKRSGIFVSGGTPQILNNTLRAITSNSSGGGVLVSSGSCVVANNVVIGNGVGGFGGGISVQGGTPKIVNNTIVANSAQSGGGGIYVEGGTPTIANNLVAHNSSGVGRAASVVMTFRYNDVYENNNANYIGMPDPTGIDGNLSIAPGLVAAPSRDLHLQSGSPLINAGNGADVVGDFDLDGESRVQGGAVDIGADEWNGTTFPSPQTVVHVAKSGDDANDGSDWSLAKKTIQAGINAVSGCGELWIAQGTYNESLVMTNGVSLYGGFQGSEPIRDARNPSLYKTVIDPGALGDAIAASNGSAQLIDSLTIQHTPKTGNGIKASYSGLMISGCDFRLNNVGIQADYSVLQITNTAFNQNSSGVSGNFAGIISGCVFMKQVSYDVSNTATATVTGNTSQQYGTFGYSVGGSSIVSGNVMTGTASSGTAISATSTPTVEGNIITGGTTGIYAAGTPVSISNNTISNQSGRGINLALSTTAKTPLTSNTITGCGDSGIYTTTGSPIITNQMIRGNYSSGNGAGVCIMGGQPTVANSRILANGSARYGGGIYTQAGSPKIVNNTIVGNSAQVSGGAVYAGGGTPGIINNILAYNTSGLYKSESATLVFRNNDVFGNDEYDYYGMLNPSGMEGNLSVAPGFAAAPLRNIHLQSNSPLKNAGSTVDAVGTTDMDGQPRVQGANVDIGADESDNTTYPAVQTVVRVSPAGDDTKDGSAWSTAKRTVQAAVDAVAGGGEVWIAAGTYSGKVQLQNGVSLYGGFAGYETTREARNPSGNYSILEADSLSDTITLSVGGCQIVDGVIIRHTSVAMYGINSRFCGVLVNNCEITSSANGINSDGSFLRVRNSRLHSNQYGVRGRFNGEITGCTFSNTTGYGVDVIGDPSISDNLFSYPGVGAVMVSGAAVVASNTITSAGTANYGVWAIGASHVIGNRITNTTYGIYATGATVSISSNVVTQTKESAISVNLAAGTETVIGYNTITASTKAAIWVKSGSPLINNNVIKNNQSTAAGGALYLEGANAVLANNLIANNRTTDKGAGIYVHSGTVKVVNSTLTHNTSTQDGGALYARAGNVSLINTLVSFNSSGIAVTPDATVVLSHTDVFANPAYDFLGMDSPIGTNGNISVDPKYVDPATMDYHLFDTSPVINVGLNTEVIGSKDVYGVDRIQHETVDLGAAEFDVAGSFGLGYVIQALRIVGGLSVCQGADLPLLDYEVTGDSAGKITLRDPVRIIRKVLGVDP